MPGLSTSRGFAPWSLGRWEDGGARPASPPVRRGTSPSVLPEVLEGRAGSRRRGPATTLVHNHSRFRIGGRNDGGLTLSLPPARPFPLRFPSGRTDELFSGRTEVPWPQRYRRGRLVSCRGTWGGLTGRRHGGEMRTTSRCTGEVTMGPVSDM